MPTGQLANGAQELCESRGGRPGVPVPNSPYGLCGRKATLKKKKLYKTELRSCVKVEVAVLGFPSLTVLMVSVDVKNIKLTKFRGFIELFAPES